MTKEALWRPEQAVKLGEVACGYLTQYAIFTSTPHGAFHAWSLLQVAGTSARPSECPRKARHRSLQHLSILHFNLHLCLVKLVLKWGSRLGRTEAAPCGQKFTPPPLPGRKNPRGWGCPRTSTAQNIQESAWGCQLIFTLGQKRISCHLTLHFEHLQTNAKPAGYLLLLSAVCLMLALPLFLQKRYLSEETPWKPPHFLTPLRTLAN